MSRSTALVELTGELPVVVSRLLGVCRTAADIRCRIAAGQDNTYAVKMIQRGIEQHSDLS
ncbi:hypothetical protein [Streptomyces sp. Agncl-13]|uniref:hypothetical protein n=1 Tax=Streptomyces sp. Agncl-13 TaxID=3400628 RepID=UPI003A83BBF9